MAKPDDVDNRRETRRCRVSQTTSSPRRNTATTSPNELVLVIKQLIYIERYITGFDPHDVLLNEPFVIKSNFPEHALRRSAELGVAFPE